VSFGLVSPQNHEYFIAFAGSQALLTLNMIAISRNLEPEVVTFPAL
jgi:hypothetical protein